MAPDYIEKHAKTRDSGLLTIGEMREHLQLDDDTYDTEVTRLEIASIELLERYIGRPIYETTYNFFFTKRPREREALKLPPLFLQKDSVSVKEIMRDNSREAIEPSDYKLYGFTTNAADNLTAKHCLIAPIDDWEFKENNSEYEFSFCVEAKGGFSRETLPFGLRQAIKIMIADFYTQRRSGITFDMNMVPQSAIHVASKYRILSPLRFA